MTREQLDALEALVRTATPGPWQRKHAGNQDEIWSHERGLVAELSLYPHGSKIADANSALIQELRNNAAALIAQAREALELREALEKAHAILFAYGNENDGTQHPWWAVVKRSGFGERAILAGPFFSRERAQQHYEARRYEYGKAIVYCFSGHYSQHYRDLRETLEAINKARRGM